MTVGIVGLGLIGGSFAKAYSKVGHRVLARDIDKSVLDFAVLGGFAEGELTSGDLKDCDLILICTYPGAACEFMRSEGANIGAKPVVIDCCGTKREIVQEGRRIAQKYGFTYVGGHPMAGTQFSGFKYARDNLYKGAPMVIVPPAYDDITLYDRIKKLLKPAGFGSITVTTAEKHDEMIAFTSQLAHIVSSAYIKSPTARSHKGMSAGSYKDMTRVAWLNPQMWAELCLDNRDNLIREIDCFMDSMNAYRKALSEGDSEELIRLLAEGRAIKEEVDG
ncbi:MAG: prephenate dehydrogenase [Clostridia bacterium]|nr:prephenate dehydrogenase [Clostridia bacterium]